VKIFQAYSSSPIIIGDELLSAFRLCVWDAGEILMGAISIGLTSEFRDHYHIIIIYSTLHLRCRPAPHAKPLFPGRSAPPSELPTDGLRKTECNYGTNQTKPTAAQCDADVPRGQRRLPCTRRASSRRGIERDQVCVYRLGTMEPHELIGGIVDGQVHLWLVVIALTE